MTVEHPDAMVVATADGSGRPSARTMILRGFDERGFVFHTDLRSRKAAEIDANPHVALLLRWGSRQVRIEGRADRLPDDEADAAWAERPREAQLAVLASPQSAEIEGPAELRARVEDLDASTEGSPPRPDRWGGYRVRPDAYEFWEERPGRLHERLRFERVASEGWERRRLAP